MKRTFNAFLLCLLMNSPNVAFGVSRSAAAEDYQGSWSVNIAGSYTTTNVGHRETGSDGTFVPINEDIRIPAGGFSLKVMKEFLNSNDFSFTLTGFGGVLDGSYESGTENLSEFTEKMSGIQYGAGLSVNYNLYMYGLKVQPYVEVDLALTTLNYSLDHKNGTDNLNTTHDVNSQLALLGVGLRAYDSEVGLMSFFSISTPQVMSEEVTATSTAGDIATPATIERDMLVFSLGFGAYF